MAKNTDGEVITKNVKLPLTVTMTGTKAALAEYGEDLVARLKENLPLAVRLGRGKKEVITVGLKA
jgi:hypothetical protein